MPFKQMDDPSKVKPQTKRKPGGKMPIPTFIPVVVQDFPQAAPGRKTFEAVQPKRPFKK